MANIGVPGLILIVILRTKEVTRNGPSSWTNVERVQKRGKQIYGQRRCG